MLRSDQNKRPTNADLRDSGSIEQDADSIIMLYREAVYDENSSAAPFAEIIVTKNRFGSLGTVYQRSATDTLLHVTRMKPDRFAQHQMHLLRVADDMHKGLTYDHLHH